MNLNNFSENAEYPEKLTLSILLVMYILRVS